MILYTMVGDHLFSIVNVLAWRTGPFGVGDVRRRVVDDPRLKLPEQSLGCLRKALAGSLNAR